MKEKKNFKQKFEKINRALHRDLGYLFIGLTLIYGLSGIAVILRHTGVNIIYTEEKSEQQFAPNFTKKQFENYWKEQTELPKITRIRSFHTDTCDFRVKGGKGIYIKRTGQMELTLFKQNPFFEFVNDIHYNRGRKFTWLALVYAFMLVFFAISGAIIAKGKKGFMKRGIWFTLLGISVPVLCYILM